LKKCGHSQERRKKTYQRGTRVSLTQKRSFISEENKAAKEAIKMEKGELEAALEGDETAMRNLITVTSSILQGEHYGSDRSLTEEEGKEFEEEFPNDVIKGYVEGALEVYKREQELKK